MDDVFSSDISSDELTWLHASALLDEPPALPLKDDDISMEDVSIFSSEDSLFSQRRPSSSIIHESPRRTPSLSTTRSSQNSPRSEWIYRRPKTPPSTKRRSSVTEANLYPSLGYRSLSRSGTTTSIRTTISSSRISLNQDSASTLPPPPSSGPFWTTILRTRSRSERSVPLLKTIPSESQIQLALFDRSTPSSPTKPNKTQISTPKSMTARPPSLSSTLSSVSNSPSPSSSRSESPVTPVSMSSYDGGVVGHRYRRQNPYHRRHRTQPDIDSNFLSTSCPPSRSILTRESSVSTKDSSHTINKSVKFAAAPVVHYASTGYWDVNDIEGLRVENNGMGINVDSMEVDDSSSYRGENITTLTQLREMQCTTPTPEREKAKGLRRLMTLSSKKPLSVTGTNEDTDIPTAHKLQHGSGSPRPVISTPYPLGNYPSQAMQSTVSLRATSQRSRSSDAAGSTSDFSIRSSLPIRTAPSCESFRSSKSTATRSVRSLGSIKSTTNSGGIRAWLGRTMGWVEA